MNGIAGCNCTGTGLGNTGYPNQKPFGVTTGILMVPILARDGSRNGLDMTSTTFGADILAMINNADASKRAYPYLNLKSVAPVQAEAVFAEDEFGVRSWLRNGIKTITYEQWDVSNQYYDKVDTACVNFGIYEIDNCGNLKGQLEGEMLYPRPMNSKSFNSMFMEPTATTPSKVVFNVDYDKNTSDGDQWMLPASEFGVLNLLQLQGMIDVNLTLVDVVSATEFVVDATFDYGYANERTAWEGATATDFTLYNNTDSAVITKTVAESTTVPGRYTFTVPAVTAADSVSLDAFRAATGNMINGFEGVELTFAYSWT